MSTAVPSTPSGLGLGAVRKPILPSARVQPYWPQRAALVALPTSIDNGYYLYPVQQQGSQGSCTGHAHALLMAALMAKDGMRVWWPSPAFNYAMARKREHDLGVDAGADPWDSLESLVDEGICNNTDMPYDPAVWAIAPTPHQLYDAKHHRLINGQLLAQDLLHMQTCLTTNGFFTFGIDVYGGFEQAPNGDVPMPGAGESLLGGHDLLAYGYSVDSAWPGGGYFLFQNSWGTGWGAAGRGRIPFAYLASGSLAFRLTTGVGIKI